MTTSAQKAYTFMKAALATMYNGERLPPLNALAAQALTSRSTMWKTLRRLKKEGLLHTNPGGAMYAGPAPAPTGCLPAQGKVWERLKLRLGQDIVKGEFGRGPLPLATKLARRYGVSFNTLKKTLDHLDRDGLVARQGRRFVLPVPGRTGLSTVVFISAGSAVDNLDILGYRVKEMVDCFEWECRKAGHGYRSLGFVATSARALLSLKAAVERIPEPAGFIVNFWIPWDSTIRRRWFDLFQYLAVRKVPVIIVDQSGDFPASAPILSERTIRILRIAGQRAGEAVAELLLRNGHNCISYVAPYANYSWSQRRYTGLSRFYRQFGDAHANVSLFAGKEVGDLIELVLAILKFDEKNIRALFGIAMDGEDLEGVVALMDKVSRMKLSVARNDRTTELIRAEALHASELAQKGFKGTMMTGLYTMVYNWASTYAFELYLHPFFSNVLEAGRATAWVCCDDKTAEAAIGFLAKKNMHIPRDLSLASFDNWPRDFDFGLTSYDFNMQGMVQEALHLIRDERLFVNRPAISEVEGFIVERRSVGKRK